ncbi:MAG: hypothetical protein EPO41_14595 [Reyranella sp.]|uniref:hypothetical protein n=1 Tax=Reyranella sp. TaxID=1929291 RepID=UPI00120520A5|nr:hypothetical protein [Reyranella sp.]TAJ92134.1 MAG: hypothetical protein EPO41_14595 [Reyranella sp.]
MKKILRYLMGDKGSPPSVQKRFVPAHELALKAVVRRRGENGSGDSETQATSALPAVAEQPVTVAKETTGSGHGATPLPRPRAERRGERKQRRREQNLVAKQVVSAGEQNGATPPPHHKMKDGASSADNTG